MKTYMYFIYFVVTFVVTSFAVTSFTVTSFAQDTITITDSTHIHRIGYSVGVFEDKYSTYSITSILKSKQDSLFALSGTDVPTIGLSRSALWLKFKVKNLSNSNLMLEVANPILDSVILYSTSQNVLSAKYSGSAYPYSHREYGATNFIVQLDVPKDSTRTFYLKLKGRFVFAPVSIGRVENMFEFSHHNDWMYWFYCGMVFMILAYNALIYSFIKEIDYFYYGGWIISICFYQLATKGFLSSLLPDSLFWLCNYSVTAIATTVLFGIAFMRSFLRLRKEFPRLDKLMRFMFIPFIITIILDLTGEKYLATAIIDPLIVVASVLALVGGFRMLAKGFEPALYYIFAFGSSIISGFIYIAQVQGVLPYSFFANHSLMLGTSIEMILFSVALASKIFTLQKEKVAAKNAALQSAYENESLIVSQNTMLEQKVRERTQELEIAQQKTDELLFNILPKETALELKEHGFAQTKTYGMVTVLLSDFKDFSKISERLSPELLVQEIDECFTAFDEIIERYDIEKIKTVGDAYLCVAGLPSASHHHASNAVKAAFEMRDFMLKRMQLKLIMDEPTFEIRIGIHTGPVVAGIVGKKKFAYDIWGDTVNTAARMEQNSEAGKINISETTYALVKDKFTSKFRGEIDAKNKGKLKMYFVEGNV
ncbi:MAG: hypothetical protein IPM69_17365 [Ignavibacteria bacterium]|nr:hypothetical protein [Ignavibacteria bacterium]